MLESKTKRVFPGDLSPPEEAALYKLIVALDGEDEKVIEMRKGCRNARTLPKAADTAR